MGLGRQHRAGRPCGDRGQRGGARPSRAGEDRVRRRDRRIRCAGRRTNYRIKPDEKPTDVSGHGTACAGIIHSIAPEAEIYSVRVLGRNMGGRAIQFAAGLDWAIENDMQVVNLSLSTSLRGLFRTLP